MNKKYDNIVVRISNYATHYLEDKLKYYGTMGYKLVNTTMASNKYGVEEMLLFFTKEVECQL